MGGNTDSYINNSLSSDQNGEGHNNGILQY